jgi:hypothetical protein
MKYVAQAPITVTIPGILVEALQGLTFEGWSSDTGSVKSSNDYDIVNIGVVHREDGDVEPGDDAKAIMHESFCRLYDIQTLVSMVIEAANGRSIDWVTAEVEERRQEGF